jgi:hypothetical protein
MPQFHSFPSVRSDDADWPGEVRLGISQDPLPPISDPQWSIAPEQFADQTAQWSIAPEQFAGHTSWGTLPAQDALFPTLDTSTSVRDTDGVQQLEFPSESYQSRQTDPRLLRPQQKAAATPPLKAARPIYDIQTTQSLVAALQATMNGKTTTARVPVVIPGDKKVKSSNKSGVKLATIKKPEQRISPHMRYVIVFVTFVLVILFSLLSLNPLGAGQNNIPIVNGVISWARSQEQSWSVGGHQVAQQQQNQGAGPIAPAVPVAPQVPASRSQYVALARMDAIDAGINPDYFVQQINVESGFNPNAVSPSGAVGIAQFLPSTAAGQGVNPWDPVSALRGAARLMASYAAQYGGNYAMALAAYNAGGGTVNYAVNAGGAYWMNYLPAETRNYIRSIMGI